MENQQASPLPQKSEAKQLSFYDALKEVTQGKKLTRIEWDDKDTYIFLLGEALHIQIKDKLHTLTVSLGDIQATDWIALSDLN